MILLTCSFRRAMDNRLKLHLPALQSIPIRSPRTVDDSHALGRKLVVNCQRSLTISRDKKSCKLSMRCSWKISKVLQISTG